MSRYDLVIIGGGTAGLTAAVGAAGVGARVLLAEEDRTGGDCLWTGCVPSKALLAAADRAHAIRTADRVGLAASEPEVDLERVMGHVRESIARIAPHDSPDRLRREGVEVRTARARFTGPGRVVIGDTEVRTRCALIATGARPVLPPVPGLADAGPLTSETVWELRTLPRHLVVVGGGPVGCELGQAFRRLGSRVTLVEAEPHLLPREEPAAGRLLEDVLTREGVEVLVGTTAVAVGDDGLRVDGPAGGAVLDHDRLLIAVGREPVTGDLGLGHVGVRVSEGGWVVVDDTLRTTGDHVFAAGDVTGRLPFTHVAGWHGSLVVTNALFGLRRSVDHEQIPWVTFTDPEVARVGLTEAQARDRLGDDVRVARVEHEAVDRAVVETATTGFTTLVGDPRGRIVGATIVGPAAGESIAEVVAWMRNGGTISDLGRTVHAYPTFTEAPWRAGLEHLRDRWLTPRTRALTRPLLALLRILDRPG